MTTVKKSSDGEYYIFRRVTGEKKYRRNYLGKKDIDMGRLNLPKDLWGKRIYFKVVVEEY